jgi:hypothetical protein
VIASHYAEPVERLVGAETAMREAPSSDGETICALTAGATFLVVEDSLGWSWGYGGSDRRVGYVVSGALAPSAKH